MKRIVTIQDISCVGKCSLTVALPIISAMGIETAIVPTAVLSNHTAFKNFTFKDLTDEIKPISDRWKKEGIDFDAIYTGYLGSFEQLKIVSDFFDDYRKADSIIFIDPVMADNGKLYAGFTQEFAFEMAKLCSKADVIVPNMTEACFMLDVPYPGNNYDETYVKNMLIKLTDLGCKQAAITGISLEEGKLGIMSYNSETNEFFSYYREKIDVTYHGTGDVFSSACVGAMMNGLSLSDALKVAVDYTVECVKITFNSKDSRWYGVDFEYAIPYLIKLINK
jgi:pyridoxine kinase